MAVATYEDVAVALGRSITSEAEQAQIEWWLTGLELIIGARLGDITLLDQDLLLYVEVEAVAAKVRRGSSNVTSETVSIDDGSYTKRYESASAGDISDDWWNLLSPTLTTGAYSTRPAFDTDTVMWPIGTPPAPWVDTADPYWRTWR